MFLAISVLKLLIKSAFKLHFLLQRNKNLYKMCAAFANIMIVKIYAHTLSLARQ